MARTWLAGSLAAFLLLAPAGAAQPQGAAEGVAVCAAANHQSAAQIAADGAGGAIVAWLDRRAGTGAVYAQRLDTSGAPLWTGGGVALSGAADDQSSPRLVSDGAGGAVVAWMEKRSGGGWEIYAQRLEASGMPLWTAGGVAVAVAAENQGGPRLVSDGAGGVIIAWAGSRPGGNTAVYVQRLDSGGTPLWRSGGSAVAAVENGQHDPEILADDMGGAIITWRDRRSGNDNIYAQRLDAGGTPLWGAGGIPR